MLQYLKQTWGVLVGAVSLLSLFPTGILYFYAADVKLPVALTSLIVTLLVSALVWFGAAIAKAVNDRELPLPRALQCIQRGAEAGGADDIVLLLSPSQLLGTGMACSLFVMENGFEVFIGAGLVQHVQMDGKMQVKADTKASGQELIWGKIERNESNALASLLVRPGDHWNV